MCYYDLISVVLSIEPKRGILDLYVKRLKLKIDPAFWCSSWHSKDQRRVRVLRQSSQMLFYLFNDLVGEFALRMIRIRRIVLLADRPGSIVFEPNPDHLSKVIISGNVDRVRRNAMITEKIDVVIP